MSVRIALMQPGIVFMEVVGMKIAMLMAMIAALLLSPRKASEAARAALRVWGLDVAPSLFPYMVFCRMLSSRLRACGAPAGLSAATLGLMGGSPSGAAVLSAYATNLSRRVLLSLCGLTGTISPMFFLSTVRIWAKDAVFCQRLLISHLAGAALTAGIVFCFCGDSEPKRPADAALSQDEINPITQSVDAILNVGGCIVFFSVLAAMIQIFIPQINETLCALLHSVLEVSGGLHAILATTLPKTAKAVLCAAAGGFTGVSILSQNLLFLRPLGITLKQLACIALLRAVCAGVIMWMLILFF